MLKTQPRESDEDDVSAEETEITMAMAAAKAELDARLEVGMIEKDNAEDAVPDGEDSSAQAKAAETRLEINTRYLRQTSEARIVYRGKLEVLRRAAFTLAKEEELQRETKKRKMVEKAITVAAHRTAHNTEEAVEDLHCDDLPRDWMAYLFNGMTKAGADADVLRMALKASRQVDINESFAEGATAVQ